VQRPGRIGEESARIDGVPKVRGEFEYSSDLWMDGMLHGATLRSPHPHARSGTWTPPRPRRWRASARS
jgi:CO/xanthine dehydrogenase Mo-binding subunit